MAVINRGNIECVWCLKPIFGRALANPRHQGNVSRYSPVLHLRCAAVISAGATAALNDPPAYIVDFEKAPIWQSGDDKDV